jgi:predicted ATP-binding protein involved in virulence
MIVEKLSVEQYRGFAARTTIDFNPHWTVIVGENGVGKTSVLWALRVLLSHTLSKITRVKPKLLYFVPDDISKEWPFLRAEVSVLFAEGTENRTTCTAQKNAERFAKGAKKDGRPREHAVDTPDKYEVRVGKRESGSSGSVPAPLVVYYSAHRSLFLERGIRKARAAGGIHAAYAEALDDRELLLGEAAEFWRKESVLQEKDGRPACANRAIEKALPSFLGEFRNMRTEGADKPRLVVDKRKTTLSLNQLSEGERGLLAVLIDLTRRLAVANPSLQQPARDGRAVVLMDELDLHMHPRWQRTVVSQLSKTFPKCQFIATTHSPQIISEVQPENLLLLRQGEDRILVQRCGQAYGLDANYVLEHIMGTAPRTKPATNAIHMVEDALETGDLETARSRLEDLRGLLHGDDPVVVGLQATIDNLEALANATDQEEK